MGAIKFGTDGWRGIIGEDFTLENVKFLSEALSNYIKNQSQKNPEDFVIGTGDTHSVREFLQIVFEDLNLNYEDFLVIDQRFYRPAEVEILVADPSKAREKLGWDPKVTFTEIALKMVRYDYDNLKKG